MRTALLPGLLSICAITSGCNDQSIEALLSGQRPEGGFIIFSQEYSNFISDDISQIGGLYYVSGGKKLSSTEPVEIDKACAVIREYGDFPIETISYKSQPIDKEIKPSIGLPVLFKGVLGGITLSGNYTYNAKLAVENIKKYQIKDGKAPNLKAILNSREKCQRIVANIKNNQPLAQIFQLTAVVTADVSGTITTVAGAEGGLYGIKVGNTLTDKQEIKWNQAVFKIFTSQ